MNSIRNCIGSLVSGPVNRPALTDARNTRHVTLINSYFCPCFVCVVKKFGIARITQLIIIIVREQLSFFPTNIPIIIFTHFYTPSILPLFTLFYDFYTLSVCAFSFILYLFYIYSIFYYLLIYFGGFSVKQYLCLYMHLPTTKFQLLLLIFNMKILT